MGAELHEVIQEISKWSKTWLCQAERRGRPEMAPHETPGVER
jgi:hypothetical protein